MSEENIIQAHVRIFSKLIFIISCYDIEYAYDYAHNLNSKTFKNFFKIIKTNDTKIINDAYEESKQIIYIIQLPIPELYSFNFSKDIFHIHLAIPFWYKKNVSEKELETLKKEYNEYLSDIQRITIHKFVNIKDNRRIYDNNAEDKLYNYMIELIEKHLNNQNKFKRMNYTGGKTIIYGERMYLD